MLQQKAVQSFGAALEMQASRSEFSAAHWNSWVEKAAKHSTKDDTGTHYGTHFGTTPVTSPSQSTTTSTSTTSTYITANQIPILEDIEQQSWSRYTSPNADEDVLDDETNFQRIDLKSSIRSLFSDPPLCFCQKLASRSESVGFGVVYDCHFMSLSNNNHGGPQLNHMYQKDTERTHICGFHVHQQAWQEIGDLVKSKQVVNKTNQELSTCPCFNFTFCVTFCLSNAMKRSSPPAPRCFCNLPAVLSERNWNHKKRICFVCRNFYIDGAKPKCSWFMWADEVAFNKPNYIRHSPSILEDANSRIRPMRTQTILKDTEPDSHNQRSQLEEQSDSLQTSKPTSSSSPSTSLQGSDLDPLTTPTKTSMTTSDCIEHRILWAAPAPTDRNRYDKMSSSYEMGNSSERDLMYEDTINTINSGKSEELCQLLQISNPRNNECHQLPKDNIHSTAWMDSSAYHDTLLPTFDISSQQQRRLTNNTDAKKELQNLWKNAYHQSTMLISIRDDGMEHHYRMNSLQSKQHHLEQQVQSLILMMDKEIDSNSGTTQQQHQHQPVRKSDSLDTWTIENPVQTASDLPNMKCQACLSSKAEYGMKPCCHFVYCLSCAEKLMECVLCKIPKSSIQKIDL